MARSHRALLLSVAAAAAIIGSALSPSGAVAEQKKTTKPIVVQEQGSFAFGGTVITGATGDTFHGDHGYVQFQRPPDARKYPLVMWHGAGMSGKAFESTPDGREGFQSIFVRRGFTVYTIDQPRQGRAGRSTEGSVALPAPTPGESNLFNVFRFGQWVPPGAPAYFANSQFPRDAGSLDQFFRQQVLHGTGGDRRDWSGAGAAYTVVTDAVAALMDKIGPAVLITNSGGANQAWRVAMKSENVTGIVAYEPTNFQFPDGELPSTGPFQPSHTVPLADFLKLTKIPIQIVYGDNLDQHPLWVQAATDARAFVDAVNRHGGKAELLHLPTLGVRGNTHFPFMDLNNVQIADLLSKYLRRKGLDRYPRR
jgi:hypothetical protein